ncbi:MAG: peptidylprolyl isomerase [Candidatus Cloacimonetes bacterium 4572_55]|nr:MAG: peptidylprolyl isomerase [Candidatus Cloacimonetes bacterium 4572_55]
MKQVVIFFSPLIFIVLGLAITAIASNEDLSDGMYAKISTNKGEILLRLHYDKTPMTVCNFVGLAEGTIKSDKGLGTRFYDGIIFHRVIENFMIQTGCPEGTGRGGPGYRFPDEVDKSLKHTGPGILSMANAGPNTNGSQFFITHVKTDWLDGKHTVFGEVVTGIDVVNAIQKDDVMDSVRIIRVGSAAEKFVSDQAAFDAYIKSPAKDDAKKQSADDVEIITKKWPNAIETPSGLKYVTHEEGSGPKPQKGQTVVAHYSGTLLDGTKFDSSYDRNKPFEFPVGQSRVIKGWDEAFIDMTKGEKRTLIIPYQLAYGEKGRPPQIPAKATLIFEVELLDIK